MWHIFYIPKTLNCLWKKLLLSLWNHLFKNILLCLWKFFSVYEYSFLSMNILLYLWKFFSVYEYSSLSMKILLCLWNCLSMEIPIYEISYLCNCPISEISYLCNCPIYEISYLCNCPSCEISYLWNLLSMKCPFYKYLFLWNELNVKCLSMKFPANKMSMKFLKCRLFPFSLDYAVENFIICSANPMKLLDNMCRVFQGYLFIIPTKFLKSFISDKNFDSRQINLDYV